jgi:hypothetical protein
MTNNAPGFPHVFLGTARPVDIWIGHVEALAFWGRLERSKYAYLESHPLIEGLALTYTPRWVPGLSVGFGRLFIQRWKDLPARDYFSIFQSPMKKDLTSWYGNAQGDNPYDNQLLAFFFRWVFPESGVEVYGEWGRDDAENNLSEFINDPDHSQAYLVGLDKVFRTSSGLLRVYAELNQLLNLRPFTNRRGVDEFYTHAYGIDYTNRGQLLGAGVGPGGSSQTLAVDLYRRGGRIGGYVERVLRNDGYYWQYVEPNKVGAKRDVELVMGLRQVLAVGTVEVGWDASYANRWHRDFLGQARNVRLMLDLRVPLDGAFRHPAALP